MEFNSNYDFYFENRGKCPECGRALVRHLGCVGWIWGNYEVECSLTRKGVPKRDWGRFGLAIKYYKKKLKYKDDRAKNLDIQGKKSYLKAND
jgi:hypothetical protein